MSRLVDDTAEVGIFDMYSAEETAAAFCVPESRVAGAWGLGPSLPIPVPSAGVPLILFLLRRGSRRAWRPVTYRDGSRSFGDVGVSAIDGCSVEAPPVATSGHARSVSLCDDVDPTQSQTGLTAGA